MTEHTTATAAVLDAAAALSAAERARPRQIIVPNWSGHSSVDYTLDAQEAVADAVALLAEAKEKGCLVLRSVVDDPDAPAEYDRTGLLDPQVETYFIAAPLVGG